MKKILFSGMLAVLCAVALSGFKKATKPTKIYTSTYWYSVNPNYGNIIFFTNTEVTFLLGPNPYPPSSNNCDYPGTYQCIVGFTSSQVDPATHQLINNRQYATDVAVYRQLL